MLRTIFLSLVIATYALAQDVIAEEPIVVEGPAVIETTSMLPSTGEPSIVLPVTGLKKLIKGNIESNPKEFRTYLKNDKSYLSYWHDIPLFFDESNKIVSMVVEIKRGDDLETRFNAREPMNPIMAVLDAQGEVHRENVHYIHHFGSIPQTYTDPNIVDTLSQLKGDGFALDIVEIGDTEHEIGDIVPVKVLGLLGVIEDGLIDYKIVAMDINAPLAKEINTLEDVEKHFPDLLSATRGFFRYYRYPEKLNEMAFNGEYKDAKNALDVITEKHSQWDSLIKNPSPPENVNIECHQPDAARPADDEAWRSIAEA
jgi:inorganic pyrophosphatase